MLVSATKTIKTVSKQLQTDETSAEKALDYKKQQLKHHRAKIQGWSQRRAQEAFYLYHHIPQSRAAQEGAKKDFTPQGKERGRSKP